MKKYYAAKNGPKPGVYNSWSECNEQINKFKNAVFKSFITNSEVEYI